MDLRKLWTDIRTEVADGLARVTWAEDEMKLVMDEFPDSADLIWHSFKLLTLPDDQAFLAEFAVRSHCREILTRVAKGDDTRPPSDAEMILACREASRVAPMNTAGAGLYFRLWHRAGFPDLFAQDNGTGETMAEMVASYERIAGSGIDDLERMTRRHMIPRLRWRTLPETFPCDGVHWGEQVTCRFSQG